MSRRKSRQAEENHPTREDDSRFDEVWQPPALLDAPPARDGMRQRWVATSILGSEVPHHTMRRFREGWTPRPADTVPTSFPVPTLTHGQYVGAIGVEGMILCELPEIRAQARERYFKHKTGELDEFVESSLQKAERAGGIPLRREVDSSVSHGKRIADDD